jgi:RNA polymerase sigma-70 factor (ECF subfamily)
VAWNSLTTEDLLRACIEGGEPAWAEFIRRFHPLIAGTVARCARRFGECSADLIDDLVQDTFLKLCANRCRILRDFRPQSPEAIFGFLKTVAFNVTLDHFRGGMAEKRGSGQRDVALDTYAGSAVAGGEGLPEVEREILLREIEENLPSDASPRDRQIFWLYYRHGMTTRAIASIPGLGLTQKGVESVIQRLTSYVRSRMSPTKAQPPEGKSSAGTF